MEKHAVAFAWFLGFALLTKVVVVPLAKQMAIPYLSNL